MLDKLVFTTLNSFMTKKLHLAIQQSKHAYNSWKWNSFSNMALPNVLPKFIQYKLTGANYFIVGDCEAIGF